MSNKVKTNIRTSEILISDTLEIGGGDLQNTLASIVAKINDLENAVAGIQKLKIGSIIMYSGSDSSVDDFLLCDGSAISRTTYADLFNVIGTTYGSGDGSSTFNLPNLINRFAQGSSTVGEYKEAGLPNITGTISNSSLRIYATAAFTGALGNPTTESTSYSGYSAYSGVTLKTLNFDASLSNEIYGNSDTVQPPALTLKYMIKYQ